VHLRLVPQPAFVLDISEQWPAKQASLEAFHSQLVQGRQHLDPPLIERLREEAAYWGKSIGTRYGEPFASREPIGMTDFRSLL
jgi:hypothetical protein